MNRNPILFRVDGASQTGYERLTRCLTFAAALQRRRRPTYFLSQLDPRSFGLFIKRAGNSWLEADGVAGTEEDAMETIQEIRRLQPSAVVVDAPAAGEPYLTELGATGVTVISFDSLASVRFRSRMVVNPLLGPGRDSYEFGSGTQLLLGARYALVRSEVRRLRPVRAQEPPAPYRALVALYDDDPNAQAEALIGQLLNIAKVERIDILARPEHPQCSALQKLAETHPERIKVALEPAETAAAISRCHFAITSGGSLALELACVGVPQVVIVQSEVNWPTAQRLEEEGAATCLGWHANVSPTTIRQAVVNLLNDPLERQAMARCGRQLIDGRGADRLVTALEVVLHPSRLVDFSEAA